MDSKKIKDIVAQVVIGFNIDNLKNDQFFLDAGIDSLDHMNILLAIEEESNIKIPDEDVEKCSSIDGIESYINNEESV
jgi:acyl carrier protein